MSEVATQNFNYDLVPQENRNLVMTKTIETKVLVRQTAQGIIEIGKNLIEIKKNVGHGNWLPWLESEMAWSQSNANRFIQAAERFGNYPDRGNLNYSPRVIFALAEKSTPDEVIGSASEAQETGEKITEKWVKENKKQAQEIETLKAENEELRAKKRRHSCRAGSFPLNPCNQRGARQGSNHASHGERSIPTMTEDGQF